SLENGICNHGTGLPAAFGGSTDLPTTFNVGCGTCINFKSTEISVTSPLKVTSLLDFAASTTFLPVRDVKGVSSFKNVSNTIVPISIPVFEGFIIVELILSDNPLPPLPTAKP